MFIRNVLLSFGLSTLVVAAPIQDLPTVDLGYGVYRASYYNETYDAFVFSNIRFAAPPTGALRFGAPQPPLVDRSKIHDGSEGFNCPQALAGFLTLSQAVGPESEDCLFLDVIVPRKVLSGDLGKVPVVFWIFGGAYTLGSKTIVGDPITLLKDSPSPVVWVAVNYRLGNFGFLGGPSLTLGSGTIPNAGLHDQRFGLQWVQNNIHLFNGEKADVTIMGNSAGGGSILHHITAYGGQNEPALFKRAVPLSPGYYAQGGHATAEQGFQTFEAAVGCAGKGVDCIRSVSTKILMKANRDIIRAITAPRLGTGPSVDGNFVPDVPAFLIAQGRFHKNITVLIVDDSDEGTEFLDRNSTLTVAEAVADLFTRTTEDTRNQILSFYPPASSNTSYTNDVERFSKIIADTVFNSNRYALSAALPDSTYNLVSAGQHNTGATILLNDVPGGAGFSKQIVDEMRRFIMNFVVTGNPNDANGGGVSKGVTWPVYGSTGRGLNIDEQVMEVVDTTGDNNVWGWWVKGLVLS